MKVLYLLLFAVVFFFNIKPAFCQQVKLEKLAIFENPDFFIVTSIAQDPKGVLWFTSNVSGGLFRYDGIELTSFKHNEANPASLASNWPECLYIDTDGIVWVGIYGSGLDRFDPSTGIFTHYRHTKDPSSLDNDTVTVIMKDHEGTMWVGDFSGLERFDPVTGKFTHFTAKPNDPASLSNNEIRAIYEDKQGTLWVGTGSVFTRQSADAGGLNRFDRKTGQFTRYMHDPKDSASLANNKVRAIFEDSKGNFWIGTGGYGLQIMDSQKGIFHRLALNGKLNRLFCFID